MKVDERYIAPRALTVLCAGLLLAMAPHFPRLPVWIPVLALVCVGWRLCMAWRGWPAPRAIVRLGLTVAAVTGTWAYYGTVLGREAGAALLVLMLSLKLLELARVRDAFLVGVLSFFLVATQFLFSQDPALAALMFVDVVVITTGLALLQDPRGNLSLPGTTRRAAMLLAQSLPLMAVMFLLFPRLATPLWGVPQLQDSAKTGVSDEMSPGSISHLFIDDSPAFRVVFDGPTPPVQQLYWRGPVLWHYDGEVWTRGRLPWRRGSGLSRADDVVGYRIALEPSHRHWLFALSMPMESPPGAVLTGDFELVRRRPVDELMSYHVESALSYRAGVPLAPSLREAALQWPEGYDRRTLELGRTWRAESDNPRAIVDRALTRFRQQPYVYTLNPAPLGRDGMDDFLFDTREGYCEHYASAFVLLMRAAGVPARIVTGYLGGLHNGFGDYLLVRQSDAHAWAEVWLEDRGWTMVDPTAAVAPERRELPGAGSAAGDARGWGWLGGLGMGWDALRNLWNRWVLSYDSERQQELLERLNAGDSSWRSAAAWLAAAGGLALALGMLWALAGGRGGRRDPALLAWRRYRRKLARHGLRADDTMGPVDLGRLARRRWPSASSRIAQITDRFVALRYGRSAPPGTLPALKRDVRRLKLREHDAGRTV